MVKIDGIRYDGVVAVYDLERTFNKLSDDASGRTQDGNMHITLVGVYQNYKMTIRRTESCSLADWDAIWESLSANAPFTEITVPYNQTDVTFTAYITSGTQKLIRSIPTQTGYKNYWGEIQLEFVAKSPNNIKRG